MACAIRTTCPPRRKPRKSARKPGARTKPQRERQEQEHKFRVELLKQIHAKGTTPLKRDDLCLIAEKLIDDYGTGNAAQEFFGKDVKPGNMKEPELLALVRVLLVVDSIDVHTQPQSLLDIARRLKVDPDKIKKELKAMQKEQAKPVKKAAAKKAKSNAGR